MTETQDDSFLLMRLNNALKLAREMKPNDRSEKDRHFAIAITELEKVIAYFYRWVVIEDNLQGTE